MRRRAPPPALARRARSAAAEWSAACFPPHTTVPPIGARALASARFVELRAHPIISTTTIAPCTQLLRRTFASGRTHSSNDNNNHAITKQSVSSEMFDELKAFLMEPVTHGASMERAKAVVATMMQQHVFATMPGQEATVMAMVADAMEDYAFVIDVYACLREAHVSPSPLTLELTALACAEIGDWKTAGDVIARMHDAIDVMHPSSTIYEHAIAASSRANKWMRAKQLLDEMLTHGLEAAPETHTQCIELCIAAHERTATQSLLTRFLATYELALAPDDVVATLRALLDRSIHAASLDHALLFRDALLQRDIEAYDAEACAAVVQLCAVQRQWHRARVVLAQFYDPSAPLPHAPHSSQYTRDICALLDDMMRHNVPIDRNVFNAALRNVAQLSLQTEAQRIWRLMQQHNVTPNAVSFAAAIAASGSHVAAADALFTELSEAGVAPSLDVLHAHLLVPSRAKQWTCVLDRYSAAVDAASSSDCVTVDALEHDARIQSLVAVALARSDQHQRMLDVFTRMKVRGLAPNLYVYGEAMFAYIHVGQWRHALLLFDHIHQSEPLAFSQRKLVGCAMLWDAAVLAATTGEQHERAAALFQRITALHAAISTHTAVLLVEMLHDVPLATLWDAFRPMTHLHCVHKQSGTFKPARGGAKTKTTQKTLDNPKVLNAVLKRAVDARDVFFADQLVASATDDLQIRFNSMTYSLMLRLFAAKREHVDQFVDWCHRTADARVKTTVFTFRAVLQHLATMQEAEAAADATKDRNATLPAAHVDAIARVLELGDGTTTTTSMTIAQLGGRVLDAIEQQGLAPDALCLEFYLRLVPTSAHALRVLEILTRTHAPVHYSSSLLHALFASVGADRDAAPRVQTFVVRCLDTLPRELGNDALAAFCAASSCDSALALLETLVQRTQQRKSERLRLRDEQVVLFLVNAASNASETEATNDDSSSRALPRAVALLLESSASLESGTMAFLLQHVIELSTSSQQQQKHTHTQSSIAADLAAVEQLLVHVLRSYSRDQVHAFLAQVVQPTDAKHLERVLQALEDNEGR